MAKGDTGARCFQGLLIMGNVVMGVSGLEIYSMGVGYFTDAVPHRLIKSTSRGKHFSSDMYVS